jgi:hypothetical protein
MLSIDDLEKTGLNKNFKWASELSTAPNKIQQLRYFEILSAA